MPTADFHRAVLPLFAAEEVDVLEWSVDVRYQGGTPEWCRILLEHYDRAGQLYGHGVHLSMLSAGWTQRQERWLGSLRRESEQRRFRHFSEHFGFMTAGRFDRGAPLPIPMCDGALKVGRDRLARLADIVRCPVGLENLALAWSEADVLGQGAFVDALLEPVDGFVLLDLHNLWCGAVNYGLDPVGVMETYPLSRVRELHISGGSWSDHADGRFRRDTHDEAVPEALDELLLAALARCPNLECVFVERMGGTMRGAEDERQFAADYRRIRALAQSSPEAVKAAPCAVGEPLGANQATLGKLQTALLEGLSRSASRESIAQDAPVVFRPWVRGFDARALEVGHTLSKKWGRVARPAL